MEILTAILIFGLLNAGVWTMIGSHSDKKQNKILDKEYQKQVNSLEHHKT